MNLKEIMIHHNIDGSEKKGTDKDTKHSYLNVYEDIFTKIKNKNLEILEIGIQFGGSSLLWHDYFPNAKLTLIDNEDNMTDYIKTQMNPERYQYLVMDAYTETTLKHLNKKYDIIIDDGPHTLESQIYVVREYTKLLKDDGILIIEDIQCEENLKELIKTIETKKLEYEVIDLVNVKNRYDDILLIIKQKYD